MIFVFACIRTRMEAYNAPRAMKGVPLALITAGIMAMAIMGLSGMGA
jgi:electron transport complex protein RnfA